MSVTFDGTNKLIVADPGTTSLDVRDVYSRWKDWAATGDNARFPQAFRVVGGDPTEGANFIAPYFFLTEGWRLRPQEADHTLALSGALLVDGGGDPIIPTVGTYRVLVRVSVPVRAEGVATGGGSGPDASTIAAAVWNRSTTGPTPGSYGAFVTGKLLTVAKFLGLR
jgi:hypothetical protein